MTKKKEPASLVRSSAAEYLTFAASAGDNSDSMHTSAHIEFKKRVGTGKNALDFQLSAYLGQLIERNHEEYSEFYIVARDQGYKSVTEFLNQSLPKKLVLQIRDIRSA